MKYHWSTYLRVLGFLSCNTSFRGDYTRKLEYYLKEVIYEEN